LRAEREAERKAEDEYEVHDHPYQAEIDVCDELLTYLKGVEN